MVYVRAALTAVYQLMGLLTVIGWTPSETPLVNEAIAIAVDTRARRARGAASSRSRGPAKRAIDIRASIEAVSVI